MLAEISALNKPAISIRPGTAKPSATHLGIVEQLAKSGLIERLPIANLATYQPEVYTPLVTYEDHLNAIFKQLETLRILPEMAKPQPVLVNQSQSKFTNQCYQLHQK